MVRVVVEQINGNLQANDDDFTVAKGESPVLNVLSNDNVIPALGSDLTITRIVTPPDQDSVELADNQITYVQSFDGSFPYDTTFEYEVSGGGTVLTIARVQVHVINREGTLNVNDDSFSVGRDSTDNRLDVLFNDPIFPDVNGALSIRDPLFATPQFGVATIDDSEGQSVLRYSPDPGFVGIDTLTYEASDGRGGTGTGMVEVAVGMPFPLDDVVGARVDPGSDTDLSVLENDRVLPDTLGTISVQSVIVTDGVSGIGGMAVNGDNSGLILTSNNTFGEEDFTVTMVDGGNPARTVESTVKVIMVGDGLHAQPDTFAVLVDSLGNDLMVLNNDLAVSDDERDFSLVSIGVGLDGPNQGGSAVVNANSDGILCTPAEGFVGEETFLYTMTDTLVTSTATVIVRVGDGELASSDDAYTVFFDIVNGGEPMSFDLPLVLNDAVFPDLGQLLSVAEVDVDDTIPPNPPDVPGDVAINSDGTGIVYTPRDEDGPFPYVERFSYDLTDGSEDRQGGVVVIEVQERTGERETVTNDDVFSVDSNSLNNLLPVLLNDEAKPGSALNWEITNVSTPAFNGIVSISGPVILYTPQIDFIGVDSFSYDIADGQGGTGTASVSVLVGHFPICEDLFSVLSDSVDNELDVLVNDNIRPDLGLSFTIGVAGTNGSGDNQTDAGGTVTVNGTGTGNTVLYTPPAGFVGNDGFTYEIADDSGNRFSGEVAVTVAEVGSDRDTGTVSITVDGINDVPVLAGTAPFPSIITDRETADPFSNVSITDPDESPPGTPENLTVTITLDDGDKGILLGVFNNDGGGVYSFIGSPADATTTIRALIFDPTDNRIPHADPPNPEVATFTITVVDPHGGTAGPDSTTTVSVVPGENAPPTAFDDLSLSTDEDTVLVIDALDNDVELDLLDVLKFTEIMEANNGEVTSLEAEAITPGAGLFAIRGPADDPNTSLTDVGRTFDNDLPEGPRIVYDPTVSPTLRALPQDAIHVDIFAYTLADFSAAGIQKSRGDDDTLRVQHIEQATAAVTLTGVNDFPEPVDDNYTSPEDQVLRILGDDALVGTGFNFGDDPSIPIIEGNVSLLDNDSDPDTDDDKSTLLVSAVSAIDAAPGSDDLNSFVAVSEFGAEVMLEVRFDRAETHILYDPRNSPALNTVAFGESLEDSFNYSVVDRHGGVGMATVKVIVTGVNDGPTANDDSFETDEDTALAIPEADFLSNDTDADGSLGLAGSGDSLTISDFDATSLLGAAISQGAPGGDLLFDPTGSATLNALARDEIAFDTFDYTISDGQGGFSSATVTMMVTGINDRPMAVDNGNATDEDTPIAVSGPGLLDNDLDFDVDGSEPDDELRVLPVRGGTSQLGAPFSVDRDGSYTFDPRTFFDPLWEGEIANDEFSYTVLDNSLTFAKDDIFSVATDSVDVTLDVRANDIVLSASAAPVLDYSPEGEGSPIVNVECTEHKLSDGAVVTISGYGGLGLYDGIHTVTVLDDDHFTIDVPYVDNDSIKGSWRPDVVITEVLDPDQGGTVAISATGGSLTYSPAATFVGVESFDYSVGDGQGGVHSATILVKVLVDALNGNLNANDDIFSMAKGTTATLEVLVNDNILPETGDSLTITETGPVDPNDLLDINPGGASLSYTPDPLFEGTRVLNYTVTGGGSAEASAQVTVEVVDRSGILNVNDDHFTVLEESGANTIDVLGNDFTLPDPGVTRMVSRIGPDAGSLSSDSFATGNASTVEIDVTGSSVLFTPALSFTGDEIFFYEVSDGAGSTAVGMASVTVQSSGFNADDDHYTMIKNSQDITLEVLRNDNLLPSAGETLTITFIGIGDDAPDMGGTVSINGGLDQLIYSPATDFVGTETFTYEISHGTLDRAQGTVTVEVVDLAGALEESTNDDQFNLAQGSGDQTLNVLANDGYLPLGAPFVSVSGVGADGASLGASYVTPAGATVEVNGAGDGIVFGPDAAFVGDDSFVYQAMDEQGGTGLATVAVQVGDLPTNDDLFAVLSDSLDNDLDVLANDNVLPETAETFTLVSAGVAGSGDGQTQGGGSVSVNGIGPGNSVFYTPLGGTLGMDFFTYEVTDDTGNLVSGNVAVMIIEEGSDRDSATKTVTVTGVNDHPSIAGAVPFPGSIADKEAAAPFTGVTIGDVDIDPSTGLPEVVNAIVSLDDPVKGILMNLNGFADEGGGVYSFTGVPQDLTDTIRLLVFAPTMNRILVGDPPISELTTLAITVTDTHGAVTGPDSGITVAVIAVNDPPQIDGTQSDQAVYHEGSIFAFSGVTITDIDDSLVQPLEVTVQIDDLIKGGLSNLDGFVDQGGGLYHSDNVTAAAATISLRGLLFTPTTDGRVTPGSPETTQFTITVNDGFATPVVDASTSVIAMHGLVAELSAGGSISILGTGPQSDDLFGYSVATSGDTLVAGVPFDDDNGNDSGSAYVFARDEGGSDQWGLVMKLLPLDGTVGANFGQSVAVSGDFIAVGAPSDFPDGTATGFVYIFARNLGAGDPWVEVAKLVSFDAAQGDMFGSSLSIDGNILAVGARHDDTGSEISSLVIGGDSGSGSVYVYTGTPGLPSQWLLEKKVVGSLGGSGDDFGYSVAVEGNTLVVGAPGADGKPGEPSGPVAKSEAVENSGAIYVFERDLGGSGEWGERVRLIPSDIERNDRFGFSVGISGDSIVAGSPLDEVNLLLTGSAYVFERDEGGADQWGEVTKILPTAGEDDGLFGFAVAIEEDRVVAGMPNDDDRVSAEDPGPSDFGSAYVFGRDQGGVGQWGLIERLNAPVLEADDQFGFSLALVDNTLAVGMPFADESGGDQDVGNAFVFRIKFNNPPQVANPVPDQIATVDKSFEFTIPSGSITDPDVGDSLVFSADLGSGTPLPGWLSFDPVLLSLSGTPQAADLGDWAIEFTGTDEDGESASDVFVITVSEVESGSSGEVFSSWLSVFFSPAELGDPGLEDTLWGDGADPDKDGRSNLLEYGLGSGPTDAENGGQNIFEEFGEDEEGYFFLTFMRRRDDGSLIYTLEISEDLFLWNSGPGFLIVTSIVPIDTEFEEVTMKAVSHPEAGIPLFVRLRIERN